MQCESKCHYRSKKEKLSDLNRWRAHGIPTYCYLAGTSEDWAKEEFRLLERCARTAGAQEVYYKGPMLKKIIAGVYRQEATADSKKATAKRRGLMTTEIEQFGLTQIRHAQATMNSRGTATFILMYALDCLMKRYNDGLPSPSDLRCRLREINYLRCADLEAARATVRKGRHT